MTSFDLLTTVHPALLASVVCAVVACLVAGLEARRVVKRRLVVITALKSTQTIAKKALPWWRRGRLT